MYKTMIAILLVLTLAGMDQVHATTVEFYEDGNILEGQEYDFAYSYNDATVDMTGGYVNWFGTWDISTLNVFGGTIDTIYASESSFVNLHGGLIDTLTYADSSLVNVYGYNFDYEPFGSSGWLSGYWQDDSPFTIYLRNSPYPSSQIVLVPEPTTAILMGLGGLLSVRMRKRRV